MHIDQTRGLHTYQITTPPWVMRDVPVSRYTCGYAIFRISWCHFMQSVDDTLVVGEILSVFCNNLVDSLGTLDCTSRRARMFHWNRILHLFT